MRCPACGEEHVRNAENAVKLRTRSATYTYSICDKCKFFHTFLAMKGDIVTIDSLLKCRKAPVSTTS